MKSPFLSTIRLMKAFYNGGFPFCEIVNYEMHVKVTTEIIHLCTRLVLNFECLSNARLSARLAGGYLQSVVKLNPGQPVTDPGI